MVISGIQKNTLTRPYHHHENPRKRRKHHESATYVYSSDCHIQRRSCYHPLQQERSYHHTCTARHRHCNPRIPHLYWPLALLVTRPISLDNGVYLLLFHKRPHNDRHHPHHGISGYHSPNVKLIQPLGKTHLHQHAKNRKNVLSSLVSLNLQSPVMCVGGRRISFPISPQLNKLWYNKNPQLLSSKSKLGYGYVL